VDENVEKILVVYSSRGTRGDDIAAVESLTANFELEHSRGRVRPVAEVFRLPAAAAAGASLGSELKRTMDECVGAIVFVDDLRPNVTYELGYLHGRGRPVLLVTRKDIRKTWRGVTDLAGAALARVDTVKDLGQAVQGYLERLYTEDLPRASAVPLLGLPRLEDNLLQDFQDVPNGEMKSGELGPCLVVRQYEPPVDLPVARNLLSGARLKVLIRSQGEAGDYSVYARVRFQDHAGRRRRVWLGITSLRRDAWIRHDERQFPGRSPTASWRLLSLELTDLLDRGFLLGARGPDFLEVVRIRAGARDRAVVAPIEVGFLALSGVDE
jgi:hypothetical protein